MTFREWFEDMCIMHGSNPERWPKRIRDQAMDFIVQHYEKAIEERLKEIKIKQMEADKALRDHAPI